MKRVHLKSLIPIYALILCSVLIVVYFGNRAVTAFYDSQTDTKDHCIIIDAGHGGVDGGASSCTGVLESAINLEIALRLDDLMHLLGINTVMIRTEDVSVYTQGDTIAAKKVSDLKKRVKIVNETKDAVLISIHQNHYADSRYSGAQVFYANTAGSKELALKMQTALVSALNPGSNRKTKKADGIYLLQKIENPGILIECGFLSNPEEESKLRSAEYQQKLCCVIAAVTSEYLKDDPIA